MSARSSAGRTGCGHRVVVRYSKGASTRVWAVVDTEFTSFASPALLSVGLVSMDGAELYVEVDLNSPLGRQRLAASTQFVHEVVAPQMGFSMTSAFATEAEMAGRIRAWLTQHRVTKILADSEVDLFLLRHLGCVLEDVAAKVVQAEYASAHHALEDARRLATALLGAAE